MHAPRRGEIEFFDSALVSIDEAGTIIGVDGAPSEEQCMALRQSGSLIELSRSQFLLPGLIDLHIHAPQWPQMGKALHLPLDQWLQEYTFPLEARYSDLAFARRHYESLVDNLLANGTTTATYFGSVHLEATKLLADIAHDRGQRAFVGKVAMDNPLQCPDFYRDASSAESLLQTRALIEHVNALPGDLVYPVVTPRFIPSCTDELLSGLAKLAREYDCHIQTHCSESDWEHHYVVERHGTSDAQSLAKFGLLTDKTILAHSILIDDADISSIRRAASGIAHCPLSNLYLSHAVFPARKILDSGVKTGLGTDIAGGASPSILTNCHMAVTASRALEDGTDPQRPAAERGVPDSRIDYREAFWMATAGGAEVLGIKAGKLCSGYSFDAIVVDTAAEGSNVHVHDSTDNAEDVLQKIIYNGSRQNIDRVWVKGRQVRA